MKKGDLVRKITTFAPGETIVSNCEDEAYCGVFMDQHFKEHYNTNGVKVDYKVEPDNNHPGKVKIVFAAPTDVYEEAEVQWVVDDEASLKVGSSYFIINISEGHWKVVHEAAHSFQSQVAHLSDDQLRERIQELRSGRVVVQKPKRANGTKAATAVNNKLEAALMGLSEEKKAELMKKLGLSA